MELLSIRGVTKQYGEKIALREMSFDVSGGEIVAILPSFLYFKSPNIPVPNNGFPHTRQYLSLLSTGDKQFM